MHAWLVPFWGIVQFLAFFNTFKMGDVDVIKVLDIVTVSSVALVLAAKYFTNVDLALALRSATGDIVDSGYIAMNGNVTRQFHRIVLYPGDINIQRTFDFALSNFTLNHIVTPWRIFVTDTCKSTSATLSPLFIWTVNPAEEVSARISNLTEGYAQDFVQYVESAVIAQYMQTVKEVSLKDVDASVTVAANPQVDSDAQVPIITTTTSLDTMIESNIPQHPSGEDTVSPKLATIIPELAQPGFFLKVLSSTFTLITIHPSRNISLQHSSPFIAVKYEDSSFSNVTRAAKFCPHNYVYVGYRYSIKPVMSALSYFLTFLKLGGQAIWKTALLFTDDPDELVDETMSPPVLTHFISFNSTPTIFTWILEILTDSSEEFDLGTSPHAESAPVHFDGAFEFELLHDDFNMLSSWIFFLAINTAMLVIVVLS